MTDVVIAGYGPAGAAAAIAAHDAGRSVLILESAERGGLTDAMVFGRIAGTEAACRAGA